MNAKTADTNLNTCNAEVLTDWNDWAVNSLRDELAAGKIRVASGEPSLLALLGEESRRIRANSITSAVDYVRVRRAGSKYRLSRAQRVMVYTVIKTRQMLAQYRR